MATRIPPTKAPVTQQQTPPQIRTIEDLRQWVAAQQQAQGGTKPCGQNRPITDIAGRINDLINCYLESFGEYLQRFVPNFIMILLLIAIMIIAGYMFLKE